MDGTRKGIANSIPVVDGSPSVRTWVIIPHSIVIEPNLHLKQEHLFREMVCESRL